MIQLFTWPTPNGQKVQIMLEEVGAAYGVTPINILRGSQFAPDFLAISPNNKIPAITDDEVLDRKSTRLNSSHLRTSRMPSSA